MILANPLLEAFGNACTPRNENSSRFGKWIDIVFSTRGVILRGVLKRYLLEESRVVRQEKGERNFNIFFQLCAALRHQKSPDAKILNPKNLKLLNGTGRIQVESRDDLKLYNETLQAIEAMGITRGEKDSIFRIVKAILMLGNTTFEKGAVQNGSATSKITPSSLPLVKRAASLLAIQDATFMDTLTVQGMTMRTGSVYALPRTPAQALAVVSSICKGLYGRLFNWIVHKINESFSNEGGAKGAHVESLKEFKIGILDIFGFEAFETNSFEQLCINLANEKLQNHFLKCVFQMEVSLYKTEGISVEAISRAVTCYPDNSPTLGLLEKRDGVFPLLRDELKIKTGSDKSFVEKLQTLQSKHPRFVPSRHGGDPHFTIKHYAQAVTYDSRGFLDKNRAKLTNDVKQMLGSSRNKLVRSLFLGPDAKNTSRSPNRLGTNDVRSPVGGDKGKAKAKAKAKAGNLAKQFQASLASLLSTIQATQTHFVRCIKPNDLKQATLFDNSLVSRQLQTSGLIEAVAVRCYGFPFRVSYEDFYHKFKTLSRPSDPTEPGPDFAKALLSRVQSTLELPSACFQLGKTRIFAKNVVIYPLEREVDNAKHLAVVKIQAFVRGYQSRRNTLRVLFRNEVMRASSLSQIIQNVTKLKHNYSESKYLLEIERWVASLEDAIRELKEATQAAKLQERMREVVDGIIVRIGHVFQSSGASSSGVGSLNEVLDAQQEIDDLDGLATTLHSLTHSSGPKVLSELKWCLSCAKELGFSRQQILAPAEEALRKLESTGEYVPPPPKSPKPSNLPTNQMDALDMGETPPPPPPPRNNMVENPAESKNSEEGLPVRIPPLNCSNQEPKGNESLNFRPSSKMSPVSQRSMIHESKDLLTIQTNTKSMSLSEVLTLALMLRAKELSDGEKIMILERSLIPDRTKVDSLSMGAAIDRIRTNPSCSPRLRELMGNAMEAHRKATHQRYVSSGIHSPSNITRQRELTKEMASIKPGRSESTSSNVSHAIHPPCIKAVVGHERADTMAETAALAHIAEWGVNLNSPKMLGKIANDPRQHLDERGQIPGFSPRPFRKAHAIREIRTPPPERSTPETSPTPQLTEEIKIQMIFNQFDVDKDRHLKCEELLKMLTDCQDKSGKQQDTPKDTFSADDYQTFCEALKADPEVGINLEQLKKIYQIGNGNVDTDWESLGLQAKWEEKTGSGNFQTLSLNDSKHTSTISSGVDSALSPSSPTDINPLSKRESLSNTPRTPVDIRNDGRRRSSLFQSGFRHNLRASIGSDCLIEGWLQKRGGRMNSALKKRYCRLVHSSNTPEAYLQYFKSKGASEDKKGMAAGTVTLTRNSRILLDPKKDRYFHIAPNGTQPTPSSEKVRNFIFKAESVQDRKRWISKLRDIIDLINSTQSASVLPGYVKST
ncbi:hypothetical protein AAMO2058_000996500 [Amorphochlora amoebiformis]